MLVAGLGISPGLFNTAAAKLTMTKAATAPATTSVSKPVSPWAMAAMAKAVAAPAAGTAQPSTTTASSAWSIANALKTAAAKVTQVQSQTPTTPTGMTPPVTAPAVESFVTPPTDQAPLPYLPPSNVPKYAILGLLGAGVIVAGVFAFKALK